MKKAWIVIGALLLVGSLVLGRMVWAQGAGNGEAPPLEPAKPARTVSGEELRVGDPSAEGSPVTMVSGSAETLPSTDLGDVTVEGWGAREIRAVKELPDAAKVEREYRRVEAPLGSVPVSGTLNPNAIHLYGPYWYNAGNVVTISISWTPGTSTFRIGLTSQQSGVFYGCQVSGGAGTCQLRVNQAGWYYPTVWNLGPAAATYSGFVTW